MGRDTNCSIENGDEWPRSEDFLRNLTLAEQIMVGVCSIFCFINLIVFIDNTYYVWSRNSAMKRTVFATVWMIGLTPVLSVLALLGMITPRIYIFQDMLNVICIAMVMYKFVQLLRAYARYYEQIHVSVRTKKIRFNLGPCCCCCFCLPTADINRSNAAKVRWMILQYPVISTTTSVLTMVTWLNGNYVPGEWEYDSPHPYLTAVRVTSILLAIYGLNIMVTPCLEAMRSLLIRPKFISLRVSMLLYVIQGILFDNLIRFTDLFEIRGCFSGAVMGNFYQNLVFCIEMFLLTLFNFWSYRRDLAPADERGDGHVSGSGDASDTGGRDIIKDLDMETQLGLNEIFHEGETRGPQSYQLDEITKTDKHGAKGSLENRYTDVTKGGDTNAMDSGYTNHTNVMEDEECEIKSPVIDLRL